MTLVPYLVIMVAWWTAAGITKYTGLGRQGARELEPEAAGTLMMLILPAGIGSWAYPIYELIAGNLLWWQTIGGVLLGVFCSLWIPRIVFSISGVEIFSHLLAVLLSIFGVVVLIATYIN